jgi:hypothetical protein
MPVLILANDYIRFGNADIAFVRFMIRGESLNVGRLIVSIKSAKGSNFKKKAQI